MKKIFIYCGVILGFFALSGLVYALPVSDSDLWQNAAVTYYSSQHSVGPMSNLFDGNEGGYGYETGNALFADGFTAGTVHRVEWSTATAITMRSFNLIAYHDFDTRDINDRGFSDFSLSYHNGSSWVQAFTWAYSNPNGDFHYGGGPSYQFNPDPHDMARSYLELTENLSSTITAQNFRAEFTQYNTGGPRIIEMDAYSSAQPIPEPATMLLFATGLVGLAGFRRRFH
ncbi:PEP-CTERM sorting domain-containing protein [Thermodesulfobacteriota bacterium]